MVRIYAAPDTPGLQPLLMLAREAGVPVDRVDVAALERLSGGRRHQGVAAALAAVPYAAEGQVAERAVAAGEDALVVVLDEVVDPGNLGAIVRSAEALGAQGVVVPARRAAGLTAGAFRASAGAVAHLPVERVVNLARYVDELRALGLRAVATAADATTDLADADLRGPIALVFGSEERGLRRLVRERCDLSVRIPLVGRTASLNVSVAAGIGLHEVARQRRQRPVGPPPT